MQQERLYQNLRTVKPKTGKKYFYQKLESTVREEAEKIEKD